MHKMILILLLAGAAVDLDEYYYCLREEPENWTRLISVSSTSPPEPRRHGPQYGAIMSRQAPRCPPLAPSRAPTTVGLLHLHRLGRRSDRNPPGRDPEQAMTPV